MLHLAPLSYIWISVIYMRHARIWAQDASSMTFFLMSAHMQKFRCTRQPTCIHTLGEINANSQLTLLGAANKQRP